MAFTINPSKDLVDLRSMTKALFPNSPEPVTFVRFKSLDSHASGKTHSITAKGMKSGLELTHVYDRISINAIFGVRPVIRGVYVPLEADTLPVHLLAKWLSAKYSVDINFNAHLFEVERLSITEYELRATEANPLIEGAVIFEYQHPLEKILKDTAIHWSLAPKTDRPKTYGIKLLDPTYPLTKQGWHCPSIKLGIDPSDGAFAQVHRTASANQVNRVPIPNGVNAFAVTIRAEEDTPDEGYLSQCVIGVGGHTTPRIEVSKEGLSVCSGEETYYFRHDFTRKTVIEFVVTDTYSVFINGKCVAADLLFTNTPHAIDNFIITDLSKSGYKNNHYFYILGIDCGFV